MTLSLDQIVSAQDLGTIDVDIPEWGGTVCVRGLSRGEQVKMRAASINGNGEPDSRIIEVRCLYYGLVSPQLSSIDDAEAIYDSKCSSAIGRIIDAVLGASGLTESGRKAAEQEFLRQP